MANALCPGLWHRGRPLRQRAAFRLFRFALRIRLKSPQVSQTRSFQEKTRSSYRYYVVGDCDMWAIQYAPAELARCFTRSKVIAFAIGAAQMFGTELFKTKVRLAEHPDMIETFPTDRADQGSA